MGFCLNHARREPLAQPGVPYFILFYFLVYRYLGLYENEIEAAKAYDVEAIKRRGVGAVTNFDLSTYLEILSKLCMAFSSIACWSSLTI